MTDKAIMSADGQQGSVFSDLMRFKPDGMTLNGWAVVAGLSRTVWADMRRHDNPSRRTLEKLLAAAGSSLAEFEALRIGAAPTLAFDHRTASLGDLSRGGWGRAPKSDIPLFETSCAGEWGGHDGVGLTRLDPGRSIAGLDRMASLSGDDGAYALTMVHDGMWPRFRCGRTIIVSPRATIAVGDDVVVRLARGNADQVHALIMELIGRDAGTIELRQFNPARTIKLLAAETTAMHKIVGQHF